jgi:uncharacterized coiled-coil protein SlyX
MSPQDQQAGPASEDRLAAVESSVSDIKATLEKLLQAVGAKQVTPAQAEATVRQLEQYTQQVANSYYDEDEYGGFDPNAEYHVRIKPYDTRPECPSGLRRRRMFAPELGQPLDGGSGQPGDIPPWVVVKGDVACQLLKYRQDPNDNPVYPPTPAVFDICTPEEREAIDNAESRMRLSALGMVGLTPQQALAEANKTGTVNAATQPLRRRPGRPPGSGPRAPQREAPSLVQGAEQFADATAVRAPIPAARSKALEGLPAAPPPPPPVTEERMRREDAGSDADQLKLDTSPRRPKRSRIDADIERAQEAFGGQVTGSVRPKAG